MAKTMCPLCGATMHINTGDPAGYEQRHPELLVVGYACQLCGKCAPDLAEGDEVVVRGSIGCCRVLRVAHCADGFKLYRVQFESGASSTFPRGKLIKLLPD